MEIYQLKVTLNHIKPPIWRRVEVPGEIRLGNFIVSCRPPWAGPTAICMLHLDSIAQRGERFFLRLRFRRQEFSVFRRKLESMADKRYSAPICIRHKKLEKHAN